MLEWTGSIIDAQNGFVEWMTRVNSRIKCDSQKQDCGRSFWVNFENPIRRIIDALRNWWIYGVLLVGTLMSLECLIDTNLRCRTKSKWTTNSQKQSN